MTKADICQFMAKPKLAMGAIRPPRQANSFCAALPGEWGDQEKPGARLDCFCFGAHGGIQRDSGSGGHSRARSAPPPYLAPGFSRSPILQVATSKIPPKKRQSEVHDESSTVPPLTLPLWVT